ncbi:uncharacterized protein LOC128202092 [Galleria mellonella]|uniref:Uncharacterized protein LOC128202092 n=1 Tax=Galleria mellonella TaxID=7137 RepID=A0ABM3N0G0_GALME|nr:uncharacterized protein LOC128202092 [Galleria mellonella]
MKKHPAYTEWADAYSCSRHRCQPGGRNLAIYTVGCKRVEAPESAIECEEVVEDTNMQFPFCCTRLRCLVVVRGEVWTRVLGQPWETLPAAPWSHMYKMKKPPPSTGGPFLPKSPNEGPVYKLTEQEDVFPDKVLRAAKKCSGDSPECNSIAPRAVPLPDIVIALSTSNEQKESKKIKNVRNKEVRHKRARKQPSSYYDEEAPEAHIDRENEYLPSEQVGVSYENVYHQPEFPPAETEKKEEKSTNLQALVDAIGTRMRDIENVVQKMSEKVHQAKPEDVAEFSVEKFSIRNRASKYLHSTTDGSTEPTLFLEDTSMNGYFSDASNSVLRRAGNPPKEPVAIYMAPVEIRRKSHASVSDSSSEVEKKHKKRTHKKKRTKDKPHKKHHKEEKRKRLNRLNSVEADRIVVSLEDSSEISNK